MKKQTQNIKNSGSLYNWLMANNESIPVVGKGATVCLWSDRHAYEVIEVSKDGKTVIVDRYDAKRIDDMGMSDCQEYEYKNTVGNPQTIVWYRGKWRWMGFEIVFTNEWKDKNDDGSFVSFANKLTDDEKLAVYDGEVYPQNVVDGITRRKKTYSPVNILFGQKNEHYDFTF